MTMDRKLLRGTMECAIDDFLSRSLFLQEYAKIIEYYNETNTAAMQSNMKFMYLRMATAQDKDLITLYTAYLSSKRVAGGVVNPNYTPDYAEFFNVLKHHAELLDSTNGRRSPRRTMTQSKSRGRSPNYRANIANTFHDQNISDSFDSNATEEIYDESLQAFLAEQQYDDGEVDIL